MCVNFEKAKTIVEEYHQEHLLSNYKNLEEGKKQKIIDQILAIDFEQINNLYKNIKNNVKKEEKIEPIEYIEKSKIKKDDRKRYMNIGIEAITKGKLAVVTMAGGQGTRLGHKGPKGTFMLGTTPDKSLFEILCDNLKKARNKYLADIPWYIMTSHENNDETMRFFENNNYFNYPKELIKFFIQGELPMVDKQGKILIGENGLIKLAADGHGGIFEAMFKNNVFNDMKQKNIEWIFVGPVDNPLSKLVDEEAIGLAVEKNVMGLGKSLIKINPEEKVGVFCKKNGKPSVIEYTEITDEMSKATDEAGELVYGESHINCNMFNIKGLETIGSSKLPYHVAFKKANYIDKNGNIVVAEEANAYKFESFIFDAFEKLDNMLIYRVSREEEFSPVKNATGIDSAETAREAYNKQIK